MSKARPNYWIVIGILFLAQVAVFYIQPRRTFSGASSVDLTKIPEIMGNWKSIKNIKFDKETFELLKPDAYICRLYTNSGRDPMELMVVYGHRKETFHAPAYCYAGSGWSTVGRKSSFITLESSKRRQIKVNKFILQKGDQKQLVIYFYIQGDKTTASIFVHQWYILMDRIKHRNRETGGAFVRIATPVTGSETQTFQVAAQFLKALMSELYNLLGAGRSL